MLSKVHARMLMQCILLHEVRCMRIRHLRKYRY